MAEENGEVDKRDIWIALAKERAEALGISSSELRAAVERELISRAATQIAKQVEDELEPHPVRRQRPIQMG